MIDIKTFGSSSSGNCYLLSKNKEKILLEAGIAPKKLNFEYNDCKALLISHEHGDHSKYVKQYIDKGIFPVICSLGTKNAIFQNQKISKNYEAYFEILNENEFCQVGNYWLNAFELEHDAEQPTGYRIINGNDELIFATDTKKIKYHFPDATQYMLECNYDKESLDKSVENGMNKKRVIRTIKNHLSLKGLQIWLQKELENKQNKVNEIRLLHLSSDNSNEKSIKKEIQKISGVPVYVLWKNCFNFWSFLPVV